MAKLPYMQFYPADYQADTRCISLAARGAWVDILCTLWRSHKRGQKTLSLEGWAGELARPSAEVKLLLIELDLSSICEMDRENDEQITIKCRRMLRDERVRRYALKRLHKHRDTSVKRSCNADETPVQRPIYQKSDIRSQISESELREEKKKEKTPLPPKGDDFEEFWKAYPKKIGKKAALHAWKRAVDKPALVDILQAIEKVKKTDMWMKENGAFIPHPSTWLNQGRWADEVELMPTRSGLKVVDPVPKAYEKHQSSTVEGEPMPEELRNGPLGRLLQVPR